MAEIVLEKYDLTKFGFLPNEPIPKLDNLVFKEWEDLIDKLPELNHNGTTRGEIMKLATFEYPQLKHPWHFKRPYVILSLLTNSYVWCESPPPKVLPEKLAVPFVKVSEYLGISPILTHAAVDLYNWELIDESKPFHLDNLKSVNLMTGTDSESWFYLIMVAIEQVGGSIIKCILDAKESISRNDTDELILNLQEMNTHLLQTCDIIKRMRNRCVPDVFWNVLRPYLSGWKNNEDLPNGLVYEGVRDEPFELFGGSAAQSSLFATIDSSLGITHYDKYFARIRDYMPVKHKDFIEFVKNNINISRYVGATNDKDLTKMFDVCIATVTKFRQLHFGLVHSYIIKMAKKDKEDDGDVVSESELTDSEKGTGGTELGSFLKTAINETRESMLGD